MNRVRTTTTINQCRGCRTFPVQVPPIEEVKSYFSIRFNPNIENVQEWITMQELVDQTFEKKEYTQCRVCGANIHLTKPGKVTSMELVNPSDALVIGNLKCCRICRWNCH